jgi:drug/metabolite transporter (DMT)-like permease
VIGLISSIFLLDEVPTGTDIVGFALMFSASFIALLSPQTASPRGQTDRS